VGDEVVQEPVGGRGVACADGDGGAEKSGRVGGGGAGVDLRDELVEPGR